MLKKNSNVSKMFQFLVRKEVFITHSRNGFSISYFFQIEKERLELIASMMRLKEVSILLIFTIFIISISKNCRKIRQSAT